MTICPQCGNQLVSDDGEEFRCAGCGNRFAVVGQSQVPGARPKSALALYLASPTIWLITLNLIAFLVVSFRSHSLVDPDARTLLALGANYGPNTLGGQSWRTVSSMFLHGGLLHLVLNMWALLNLGMLAEILFGSGAFTLLYLVCGVGGAIASAWWHPGVVGVGASGAIFGIAGALLPALAFHKNERLRAVLRGNLSSIAFFVVYNILFGAAAARIDNAAHLGGLGIGLVLGLLLPSSPGQDRSAHTPRRIVVFAGTVCLLVAAFLWVRSGKIAFIEFAQAEDAFRAKDYNRAAVLAESSARRKPEFVSPHYLLGTIHLERGDNAAAARELQKTVELRPGFADAYSQLCVARLRLGDSAGASSNCKRAVELEPNDSDKHFNLGLTQRASGENAAALKSFQRAVELKPDGAEENYFYGVTLEDAGDYNSALRVLEQARKLSPTDPSTAHALARAYLALGRESDARKLLDSSK